MINKKLIREWIAALRSGAYKQGTGYLRRVGSTPHKVDRFCCLGVACSIINDKLWHDIVNEEDSYAYNYDSGDYIVTLPPDYLKKLGISSNEEATLISMNDNGKKFHEIADYLQEKYLER